MSAGERDEAPMRADMAEADWDAYRRQPEHPDPLWIELESWTEE